MQLQTISTLLLLLLITQLGISQDEHGDIRATLMNYIDGTSYNQVDQIKKAFHPESDLFLDAEDGNLRIVASDEYIGFFNPDKAGQFNGRVGNILMIEQFGNIAMAKAEILLPSRGAQYIDMFILKKVEGRWQIISKTANSVKSERHGKKVLFVTSNIDHYGDSDIKTGNSYSEITYAYDAFVKHGYTVHFVSPAGGKIPIAYINPREDLEMQYLRSHDMTYAISHTLHPGQIKANEYEAIYYVGGGSAMYEVPENSAIQRLVMDIYEKNNGVISAVCHGTAGIVNLKQSNGQYLVKDKDICGYPEAYERKDKPYFKQFPFLIGETIEKHGGKFTYGERSSVYTKVDGRVVTGQNNLSSTQVALKVIEIIEQKKD